MRKIVIAIAVAVAAISGCSSDHKAATLSATSTTFASAAPSTAAHRPNTSVTPSTTSSTVSDVPPTSTPLVPPTTPQSFDGYWHVHGAQLRIYPNGVGIETSNCGGGVCVETDHLALSLSPDRKRMTGKITNITWWDSNAKKSIPDPGESPAVGDSFSLAFVAPHLLKETIIHSSLPMIDQKDGNPYWCGKGLALAYNDYCGL